MKKTIAALALVLAVSLSPSREQAAISQSPSTAGHSFINSLGMKFVLIPAGAFVMGSPSSELGRFDNEIQHQVTISRPFYIQTTEVTQGQWKAIMGYNPSYFKDCGDDCPVEYMTWDELQSFIRRLNAKEGTNKYRLPTEAEWEYACRAGSRTALANGGIIEEFCGHDPNLDAMGWYCGNSGDRTHRVAQKQPNAWGLYDMHGNVYEWCQDWFDEDYPTGSVIDPAGPPSGSWRVERGGHWGASACLCRSAYRHWMDPEVSANGLGFRLARTP